jgi:hypothetical protein
LYSLETFDLVEIDVFTSMTEDAGTQFLLDGGILLRRGGGLRTKVCLAVFLFLCCILGMGDELVVREEKLVELLDVLCKRVPSRLLEMGQRAPKGCSKIGYAPLVTATGAGHLGALSAPKSGWVTQLGRQNGGEVPEENECIWGAIDMTDGLLAGMGVTL